jgi:hypothetical protein
MDPVYDGPIMRWTCLFLLAAAAWGGEWPQFRGMNGAGVSDETGLPVEFGPAKNVVWKTALPPGHSRRRAFFSLRLKGKNCF